MGRPVHPILHRFWRRSLNTANSHHVRSETKAFPRPRMQREEWTSLNGRWDFAFDRDAKVNAPEEVLWDLNIQVPFSPET
jgi:hypothetical protein